MTTRKLSMELDEQIWENLVKEQGKRMNETGKQVYVTDIITEVLKEKFGNKK